MSSARPSIEKIRSILNHGLDENDPNLAKRITIRNYEYDTTRDCLKVELQISRYSGLFSYIVNNQFYNGDDENTGSNETIYVYFNTNEQILGKNQQLV